MNSRLLALCALATSTLVRAQAPVLAALPARPLPGSIVRLALTTAVRNTDPITSVRGSLAGEPLHFMPAANGGWHAIGGIPADAEGTLVAHAFALRRSGRVDTVRASMRLPPIPPVKAEPLAVDSSFSKPMPSDVADRVNRENARAREIGREAHNTPALWTEPFERP